MRSNGHRVGSALIEAYRSTDYVAFDGAGELVLRIGVRNRNLDWLMARHRTRTAAFITAWNPRSIPHGDAANRAADTRLIARVRRMGLRFLFGEGRGQDRRWTPERSILVFGIDRYAAARIGRAFGQNAIVHVRRGHAPELMLLR